MANDLTELNSLRQALTPYDDVKFELNLNRHPKAHKNKSIVYAENMKLSKDGSVLENEESIDDIYYIKNILSHCYDNNYKIIHIIPCNKELVLFVKSNTKNVFDIWRYRENNEKLALFYNKGISYNNGKFSGTFTYTSNDSLIIAFCEYDSGSDIMNPMMTINLGTFTNGNYNNSSDKNIKYIWISSNNEFNDRELEPYKLPICPEVSLPQVTNISNIKGNSYIGTYYVYIRYKINKYDYTQWFNIGYPIINEFKQDTIIHNKNYKNDNNKSDDNYGKLIGAYKTSRTGKLSSYFNQNVDLINNCINITIEHPSNLLYDYCQIGFICVAKTYTKYYKSSDIKLTEEINISSNINNLFEEVFNINLYENYYNVKNIINKDNKLYISNYITTTNNIINTNNIKLNLYKENIIKNQSLDNTDKDVIINNINLYNYTDIKFSSVRYPESKSSEVQTYLKYINIGYFLDKIGKTEYIKDIIEIEYYYHSDEPTYLTCKINDLLIGTKNVKIKNTDIWKYESSSKILSIVHLESNNYVQTNRINCKNYNYFIGDNQFKELESRNLSLIIRDTNGNITNRLNLTSLVTSPSPEKYLTENYYPENYQNNNVYYNNTLDNKINNNTITSLCQGEVYDFYIHFIDKYGYITDGYKLHNNSIGFSAYFNKPDGSEQLSNVCFVKTKDNYILVIPKHINVFIDKGNGLEINIDYWFVRSLNGTSQLVLSNKKTNNGVEISSPEYISNINYNINHIDRLKEIIENLKYLPENILKDLTYGDIFDYQPPVAWDNTKLEYKDLVRFITYTNSQNELFFKVPKLYNTAGDIQLGLKVEIGNIKDYGDYVSYFISHKKLEKTYTLDGFGTKNQLNNILLNNNFESGNIIKLYNIKFEKNWDSDMYDKCTLQKNIITSNGFTCYTNLLNKLAYAQDAQNNRTDRQTTLYLSDSIVEFEGTPIEKDDESKGLYGVKFLELLNLDKNKYINNNKLYRLGNIQYTNNVIIHGLNGKYDKQLAVKYGGADSGVNNIINNTGLGTYGNVYLYEIFSFYDFNELGIYLSEKAKFNNIYKSDIKIGTDTFYEVITTLNLFNYKISNIYDTWINFYNVFDKNNDFLKEFNRTIYRSQVISDEGRTNNWRYFENDAYKNIEENKGNITNIVAIGNYLYVHTEHSLFAFSEDNTLSMNNQNLQVATPDIFDTDYKEVFITKLGYGGLQDKDAWISGQFGYIWFDRDSKKIFKVYGNSMDIISNDIQEWLDNAYISKIRFANDIKNNRILIYFVVLDSNYNNINVIMSYNILSKTFISFHSNIWLKSYNTKNNLYYLINDKTIAKYNKDRYGKNLNDIKNYSVSFIVNSYYKEIKYLEHIIFKLRQRNIRDVNNSFNIITDYYQFPVEQYMLPFQPKSIRVYNDLVDTGIIKCASIDNTNMPKNNVEDYKTPYWDLGNWNFNFLRDIKHYPKYDYKNQESRLFGNYFVITFNFGNVGDLIEFENLDVQLTKDKNL